MDDKDSEKILVVVQQLAENVGRLISNGERIMTLEEQTLLLFKDLKQQVNVNADEASRRAEALQRNIEFIVQQQAQFAADMQQLREVQVRSEQRWERTEESVRSLHAIAQIHEREITALAESQSRTNKQMAETDERINALVNVVERFASDRK